LRGHGLGVKGIARKDLDRQWHAPTVAEQSEDDLHLAAFAVAVVAEGTQVMVFALQVAAGHIVEEERRLFVGIGFCKKPGLDAALMVGEPRQVFVKVVFVEGIQPEQITAGVGAGQAHGTQARALIDDAGDDLPQGELALAV